MFENNHGLDFVDLNDDKSPDEPSYHRLRVRKDQTYGEFKQELAAEFGLPVNHIRCWFLVNRQNRTIRPDAPIPEEETNNSKDHRRQAYHSSYRSLFE